MTTSQTPRSSKLSQLYKAGLDAMISMGIVRAVILATAASTLLSVVVCGLAIYVSMPYVPPIEWLPFAVVTPAVVSPLVSWAIFTMAYELAETRAALANTAATDPLTGVGNRRRFYEGTDRDLARSRRDGSPISIVMMDIDHFKRLNDQFGHEKGDAALVAVAETCSARLRETDLFCRWGGEEFIALLPLCSLADAIRLADALRAGVEAIRLKGVSTGLTISLGVAEIGPKESLSEAIARADELLYQAKAAGRNIVRPAFNRAA
ncbi:GGDEF domain-containing protein [Devosia sp. 2618]|uniref:GGDEF domain-containing protein n=1 Tax=Devosia sp. 2618 TaxID=3156454 RepID=UPI003393361A